MFSETIRVFNDCSSASIAMKVVSVFPRNGIFVLGEDFGVIEPNSHKDVRFRVLLPPDGSAQKMILEDGEVKKCVRLSLGDVIGVKEIRLVDRGFEVFAAICVKGNSFQRIRLVWKLKDFRKICSKKTRNLNQTLFSKQSDYDVIEDDEKYPLLLPLLSTGIHYS